MKDTMTLTFLQVRECKKRARSCFFRSICSFLPHFPCETESQHKPFPLLRTTKLQCSFQGRQYRCGSSKESCAPFFKDGITWKQSQGLLIQFACHTGTDLCFPQDCGDILHTSNGHTRQMHLDRGIPGADLLRLITRNDLRFKGQRSQTGEHEIPLFPLSSGVCVCSFQPAHPADPERADTSKPDKSRRLPHSETHSAYPRPTVEAVTCFPFF